MFFALTQRTCLCIVNITMAKITRDVMPGEIKRLSLYLPRSRNNAIARAFLSFVE